MQPMLERERNFAVDEDVILQLTTQDHGTWDLRLRLKAVTDVDQQPLLVMIPISSTRLSPDRPAQAQATATFNQNPEQIVSILVEHNGAVLMQDNGSGYLAIPQAIQTEDTAQTTAARLLTQAGVSADVGFVYSAYRDIARNQQHIIFLCHAHHAEAPKGVFMDPDQSTLMDIADPVVCSVISRFERESQAGLFGTYVGNERHGDVQASTDSAQQK
ncbi:hypothetical protein [Phaeobacter sp.]|uniref:hypothetical protein n=1 Tax=Phaeobacter sp. TaxID=1902409 RepID=UPI0025FC2DA8|nr:hypothetical protein [Phaeobacter sp.]